MSYLVWEVLVCCHLCPLDGDVVYQVAMVHLQWNPPFLSKYNNAALCAPFLAMCLKPSEVRETKESSTCSQAGLPVDPKGECRKETQLAPGIPGTLHLRSKPLEC